MATPEGLCTLCSATGYCQEHKPEGKMTKPKVPRELDAIADTALGYRPKARSKPAIQRKRRKTILEKKRAKDEKQP